MFFVFSSFFFFKQKTAYEMRISDWSSDVCSSDLVSQNGYCARAHDGKRSRERRHRCGDDLITISNFERAQDQFDRIHAVPNADAMRCTARLCPAFFESLYFLTQNIPAGSENAHGGIGHCGADFGRLGLEVANQDPVDALQ